MFQNDSLYSVFKTWCNKIDDYQSFWNVLDILDQHALIIDPMSPSRRDNYRRILLGNKPLKFISCFKILISHFRK